MQEEEDVDERRAKMRGVLVEAREALSKLRESHNERASPKRMGKSEIFNTAHILMN